MMEYFQDPRATDEASATDGYLRSGDLGYATSDGGFVYLARMGDVLRLGGFLVAPAEIEEHLNAHPMVSGAQVVGVQTERGTRPVGFVTLTPAAKTSGLDESQLRDHCLSGLAKFKAPDRIIALDEFPTTKSANGTKIQKAKLRDMAIASIVQRS